MSITNHEREVEELKEEIKRLKEKSKIHHRRIYPELPKEELQVEPSYSRKRQLPTEMQFIRNEVKQHVIMAAASLLEPAVRIKQVTLSRISKLEYMTSKAVASGNYKFIQYLLDQAIGRAITPIVAKHEGDVRPKAIIKRSDGTIVEYSIQERKEDEDIED